MNATPDNRAARRLLSSLRYVLKAERIGRFIAYAGQRFVKDGGPRQAAGLSYASLLAIVPLLAVGLSFLAGFPAFEQWRLELERFVFDNMLPDAGVEISEYLAAFIENARKMTGPGMIGLALTAILLMSNINGALNQIWRISEPRPIAARLVVYWTVLTLGPLFIGASLSLSSYAFAMVELFDEAALGGLLGLSKLVSTGFSALGFAVLYLVVPNRSVPLLHGLAGGLVAALLFEGLKAGFGLYLHNFPSYQLVYGAVSAVPIFLVWMYLSWVVILFGAEVAAALPEWRAAQARGEAVADSGARLALALSLLARLREASRSGERPPKERALCRQLPATPEETGQTLDALSRAGFVERGRGGRWILCRDLGVTTLGELADALKLGLRPGEGWHPAAIEAVAALASSAQGRLDQSVADALDAAQTAPARHEPLKRAL